MVNRLTAAFIFLFLFRIGFSQEIRISSDMPESGSRIIGFWGNRLISCSNTFDLELRVLDTTFAKPKVKTFRIGPQVEDAKKAAAISCFIHDDFIYEIYYVFTNTVMPGHAEHAKGYDVIVKRDLKTMQIVAQRIIYPLNTQVKFIRLLEDGFYVCFGSSEMSHGRGVNYLTVSPSGEIVPKLITGFDYDLEPLASLDLRAYESRGNRFLNELSVEENSRVTVPILQKGKLVVLTTDFSGDSVNTALEYALEEGFQISSAKVRLDEKFNRFKGIFIVNRPVKETTDSDFRYGYTCLEWDMSGKLVSSKLVPLRKEDIVSPEIMLQSELDLSKVSRLNLDANLSLFEFLHDGSVLYAANTISSPNFMRITNSKFLLCISADGDLKWTKILPYSSNELYTDAFFFLQNEELHVYTKEFIRNFSSGAYQYDDSRGIANGLSVVMTERIIDPDDGKVIAHKPLVNLHSAKYDFFWPVTVLGTNDYLLRYRFTKGNKDKWVRISY